MARIIILSKRHLGAGKYFITGLFKFTKAADSIGTVGNPTILPFELPAAIDLLVQNTRAKRRAAIVAELAPACAQLKAQIVAEEAAAAALADNAADFDTDLPTDNGTDIGSV